MPSPAHGANVLGACIQSHSMPCLDCMAILKVSRMVTGASVAIFNAAGVQCTIATNRSIALHVIGFSAASHNCLYKRRFILSGSVLCSAAVSGRWRFLPFLKRPISDQSSVELFRVCGTIFNADDVVMECFSSMIERTLTRVSNNKEQ
jgi:hypothetical protein